MAVTALQNKNGCPGYYSNLRPHTSTLAGSPFLFFYSLFSTFIAFFFFFSFLSFSFIIIIIIIII